MGGGDLVSSFNSTCIEFKCPVWCTEHEEKLASANFTKPGKGMESRTAPRGGTEKDSRVTTRD